MKTAFTVLLCAFLTCLASVRPSEAARSVAQPALLPFCDDNRRSDTTTGRGDTDKILQVPVLVLSDPYHRRCDVSNMSVAVRENGELRDIYRNINGKRIPDDRSDKDASDIARQKASYIDPVIDNLRRRVAKLVDERVKAGRFEILTRSALESDLHARPIKILIYAHGGLVSQTSAVLSAEALAPMMMRDGYAPIFLIWNSDLPISYWDRLCCVFNGSRDPVPSQHWYLVPVRLVSDIGSSVATAPENYIKQVIRFTHEHQKSYDLYKLDYGDLAGDPEGIGDCAYFGKPNEQYGVCPNIIFPAFNFTFDENDDAQKGGVNRKGSDDPLTVLLNGGHHNKPSALSPLYIPLTGSRIITTATLSQVGAHAWDDMLRRTRLPFDNETIRPPKGTGHCETYPQVFRKDEPFYCREGGFERFFRELDSDLTPISGTNAAKLLHVETVKFGEMDVPVTIEFYGHSMGAIMGDELISHFSQMPYSKVVYMAAADTIRDFKYATQKLFDSERKGEVRFYSLSLHPLRESKETEYGGVVPEGSLLEWIDEMFNGPKTADDRTLGKWKNLESTLPTWDKEVLRRINIRVFPAQNNLKESPDRAERDIFDAECDPNPPIGNATAPIICHPLQHGDFNHYSFWRQMYQVGAFTKEVN